MLGAVLAGFVLRGLFGPVVRAGANAPRTGIRDALVMEAILTFFLVTVILATATNKGLVGYNAAIAVGATIALGGLFAAPISGASMNPARSLGPALVGGQLGSVWVHVVGPVVGAPRCSRLP